MPSELKPTTPTRGHLDALHCREIAAAAQCDPRTVAKYVGHKKIQPIQRRRIESVLRGTEHAHLIWPETIVPKVPQ